MESHEWSKIITSFLACAYRPALIGLPAEMFAFHYSFSKIFLINSLAGITSSVVFGFLSEEIIVLYEFILRKLFPNRKKKRNHKRLRFLIKAKKYFGIGGIAIVSPILLSIPFGTFIAIRFFGNRNKTMLLMSVSSIVWTVVLYFIYLKFQHHFFLPA